MIDEAERIILRDELARLVAGESTNAEFEDKYNAQNWDVSQDRGIAVIAEFGTDLCDFEHVLLPFRLTGKFELTEEARFVAERCNLFLQSSREYEWPERPSPQAEGCFAGIAIFWGFPFAIALGLIASIMAVQRDWGVAVPIGVLAVLAAGVSTAAIWSWSKIAHREQIAFEGTGDYDVWPFFRRDDYTSDSRRASRDSAVSSG